jgi:hypothetical protein
MITGQKLPLLRPRFVNLMDAHYESELFLRSWLFVTKLVSCALSIRFARCGWALFPPKPAFAPGTAVLDRTGSAFLDSGNAPFTKKKKNSHAYSSIEPSLSVWMSLTGAVVSLYVKSSYY